VAEWAKTRPNRPVTSPTCNGKEHEGGEEGRKFFVEEQNEPVLLGFFFKKKKNFNKGILVIMHPKTMSFWIFHPF
jgi:hypothetical protein